MYYVSKVNNLYHGGRGCILLLACDIKPETGVPYSVVDEEMLFKFSFLLRLRLRWALSNIKRRNRKLDEFNARVNG